VGELKAVKKRKNESEERKRKRKRKSEDARVDKLWKREYAYR
jgi:hypothetical protein